MSSPVSIFSRERTDSPWPDSRNAAPARVPKLKANRKPPPKKEPPPKKRKMTEFAEIAYSEDLTRDVYTSMEKERTSRDQPSLGKLEQARALLAEEVDVLETVLQAATAKGPIGIRLPDVGAIKQYRAALPGTSGRSMAIQSSSLGPTKHTQAAPPSRSETELRSPDPRLNKHPQATHPSKGPVGFQLPDLEPIKYPLVAPPSRGPMKFQLPDPRSINQHYIDASVGVDLANEDLEAELETQRTRIESLEAEVAKLELSKEGLEERLDDKRTALKKCNDRLNIYRSLVPSLQSTVREKTQELSTAKNAQASAESNVNLLEQDVQRLKATVKEKDLLAQVRLVPAVHT